jgi:hypothetical protein
MKISENKDVLNNLAATFLLSLVKLVVIGFIIQTGFFILSIDCSYSLKMFLVLTFGYNPMLFVLNFVTVFIPVFLIFRNRIESNTGQNVMQSLLPLALLPVMLLVTVFSLLNEQRNIRDFTICADSLLITFLGFYFFVTSYKQLSWKINLK